MQGWSWSQVFVIAGGVVVGVVILGLLGRVAGRA